MAYVAREIKDRVALGDDCFTWKELEDGRFLFTPPQTVMEPGTGHQQEPVNPLRIGWFGLMNRVFDDIQPC